MGDRPPLPVAGGARGRPARPGRRPGARHPAVARGRARARAARAAAARRGRRPPGGRAVPAPAATASAFAGDFLAIGPQAAVDAARARAGGEGASLADARVYERAGDLERVPVELYAPADGVRRLLADAPALLRAVGAFADSPQFEGVAAGVVPEERGVRIRARLLRAPDGPPG